MRIRKAQQPPRGDDDTGGSSAPAAAPAVEPPGGDDDTGGMPAAPAQGPRGGDDTGGTTATPARESESVLSPVCTQEADVLPNDEECLHIRYLPPQSQDPACNWLDKLRASKGLPVLEPNLGIEDFLASCGLSPNQSQALASELGGKEQANLPPVPEPPDQEAKQGRLGNSTIFRSQGFDIARGLPSFSAFHNDNNDCMNPARGCCSALTEVPVGLSSDDVERDRFNIVNDTEAKSTQQDQEGCMNLSPMQVCGGLSEQPRNFLTSTEELCQGISGSCKHYVDMFADLFCMDGCFVNRLETCPAGGKSDVLKKKHPRKQQRPKVCRTSMHPEPACTMPSYLHTIDFDTPPLVSTDNALDSASQPADDKCTISPDAQTLAHNVMHQPNRSEDNEVVVTKVKENADNKVTSRNEIFVIDTSLRGWRAEKIIVWKGNTWKIKDKGTLIAKGSANSTVIMAKKGPRPSHLPLQRTEQSYTKQAKKKWQLGVSNGKVGKDVGKPLMVPRAWKTTPQTHARSQRKPRKSAMHEDESMKVGQGCSSPVEQSDKVSSFAPDHPANQPKEGLVYSIYQVFMQAGKAGLTAREAVSRILEQGLPGLHEGGVVPRVEVLKIISNSPYFMPLVESKYILCSALVGDEDQPTGKKQEPQNDEQGEDTSKPNPVSVKLTKHQGIAQYWAACAAIRRARTGKTQRKPSMQPAFLNPATSQDTQEATGGLSQKKRLKSMKQDTAGLGNPCNRSDGKGWHCPLRAKVGYLLCDHHLDRLRVRVKSHVKSKMVSMNKGSKQGRKKFMGDTWVVKKVVERSRISRLPHIVNDGDAQVKTNSFPWEPSSSKDFFRA